MTFRVLGLDPTPFRPLYGLDDAALAARRARRMVVDAAPGYPERIELRDAEPGETLLLVNHAHQPADTPFHAAHAIFVREGAERRAELIDTVPEVMRIRPISLRAFDREGMMIDAALIDGEELAGQAEAFLARTDIAYLHAHYAAWGCYAGRIERA